MALIDTLEQRLFRVQSTWRETGSREPRMTELMDRLDLLRTPVRSMYCFLELRHIHMSHNVARSHRTGSD
jgi:hypothetical protein